MKDSGPIFETEKQLADSFSLRKVRLPLSQARCADIDFPKTDVTITETAKALRITSFIVVPSTVCRASPQKLLSGYLT
jgi:hypothetical protein